MPSVKKIEGSWRALIRLKGRKPISKRFRTKAEADIWAHETERRLREGRSLEVGDKLTVADLIQRYRKLRDVSRPILDTSNDHYMLKHLTDDIGEIGAARLTSDDLVGWAQKRKDQGAGPYTINMELSKLGTVYRYAGMSLGLTNVVPAARPLLNHLGLIGGGGQRERRPTSDELQSLIAAAPAWLADVIQFAVATAMRRGEIVRLRWVDVDEKRRVITVRDRKDPRRKQGNDMDVPLLPRAWDIVEKRRGSTDPLLFPYHEQTISKYFKQLCTELGIPDLHFHDLRHEGTSQLFEDGFAIQEVALVTGHKDWRNLRRYTNLKPESLHERDRGRDK